MKLKRPRKSKLSKKSGVSPRQFESVSTASCSQSNNLSDLPSPLSTASSPSSRGNDNNNVSKLDDGAPSNSALNDLQRVLKLIEAERHLAAHQLYVHARDRVLKKNNHDDNNNNNNTASSNNSDASIEAAGILLQTKRHEFETLEKRHDIFSNAKLNLAANNNDNNNDDDDENKSNDNDPNQNDENSWILAQTLFGITTYYRREPIDNSLSIKIEGELSDDSIPLFEQIVVLRECDLYHKWAPFMSKSRKLAQLDKLDVVAWYEVGVPLLGLMRDACYRAVGCDCMKEDGMVLLVAVGLHDSEEHGVKSALLNNTATATTTESATTIASNSNDDDVDSTNNNEAAAEQQQQLQQQRQQQNYMEQTAMSNLVTDTVASSFLARDEILDTIEIPPIPQGTGKGRMTIRNFAASIDVLGPSSARTCIVVNIDPNLHFLPQSLIDFSLKKMAGVMILKLQQAAKRVVADPIRNPHARRMREDVSFYRDWLLPRFQQHCDELGWEMPPVTALEVSDEVLRAEGVFEESWRSEMVEKKKNDDGGGGTNNYLNHDDSNDSAMMSIPMSEEQHNGYATTIASPTSSSNSSSNKSNTKAKLAKIARQLRSPETPEEKIAAARRRAAQRLQPEPFSDSKKKRLKELKGVKRKAEDRIRANEDYSSSCDEGSVSTYGTLQTIQRWDENSGLKKNLVIFPITLILNIMLPYFSSEKFLSTLSSSFKQQLFSMASETVPLLFICLQAICLRSLLDFLLIFAFDSIDFGQKKYVQNMELGRKLYQDKVHKYSLLVGLALVGVSCGLAFLRFFFEEVTMYVCYAFRLTCVMKESSSCGQLGLRISTYLTTRLGIFVVAVLAMACIVLPKPERRVVQKKTKKCISSPRSAASPSSSQIDSEDAGGESVSILSVSTPRDRRGDIPDTIGGNQYLTICGGTFSPVGSMSMDPIDEEEEE